MTQPGPTYYDRNKARATVVDENGETRGPVGYQVQGRTARMRLAGRQTIERSDVVNFQREPPFRGKYNFVISFENGDEWHVAEAPGGGCGCGKR